MPSKPNTQVPSSRLRKKSTAGQSNWLGPLSNGLLFSSTRSRRRRQPPLSRSNNAPPNPGSTPRPSTSGTQSSCASLDTTAGGTRSLHHSYPNRCPGRALVAQDDRRALGLHCGLPVGQGFLAAAETGDAVETGGWRGTRKESCDLEVCQNWDTQEINAEEVRGPPKHKRQRFRCLPCGRGDWNCVRRTKERSDATSDVSASPKQVAGEM